MLGQDCHPQPGVSTLPPSPPSAASEPPWCSVLCLKGTKGRAGRRAGAHSPASAAAFACSAVLSLTVIKEEQKRPILSCHNDRTQRKPREVVKPLQPALLFPQGVGSEMRGRVGVDGNGAALCCIQKPSESSASTQRCVILIRLVSGVNETSLKHLMVLLNGFRASSVP